jgi:hypothetical protein
MKAPCHERGAFSRLAAACPYAVSYVDQCDRGGNPARVGSTTWTYAFAALRTRPAPRLRATTVSCSTGTPIGRIMKVQRAGGAWTWFWSFIIFPSSAEDRGDAETLDEAKVAFRHRVEAAGLFDPRTMRHTR